MGDSGSSTELNTNIHWTTFLEDYFATTGEKANGLSIMHKKAESLFTRRKTAIDLPVIVGSGVIAFLNAGSQSLFSDPHWASVALGVGSLFVGTLNTIGTYFGWAKRAEGHRIASIYYGKLYRFISVELRLPREERMSPHDFLKYVKDQYDRLAEMSPPIPSGVTQEFTRKAEKYKDVAKPEETNGLNKINIYIDPGDDGSVPLTPPVMIRQRPSSEEITRTS